MMRADDLGEAVGNSWLDLMLDKPLSHDLVGGKGVDEDGVALEIIGGGIQPGCSKLLCRGGFSSLRMDFVDERRGGLADVVDSSEENDDPAYRIIAVQVKSMTKKITVLVAEVVVEEEFGYGASIRQMLVKAQVPGGIPRLRWKDLCRVGELLINRVPIVG